MFTILLHSSKTMRAHSGSTTAYQQPALINKATELAGYVQSLSPTQIQRRMHLSKPMAVKTHALWQAWNAKPGKQLPAIDAFLGDIYSGLQVQSFSATDRMYANEHLYILSGLYGVLRALDGIVPYRLEMGYKLLRKPYQNLYTFWGDAIAHALPAGRTIINLSAVEYTKAVLPFLPETTVITPKFLTVGKTGEPTFVTVHAKVARGAFAHWLIAERVDTTTDLQNFTDLNYHYDPALSTPEAPVFVCQTYGGLGLSVRLS